MNRKSIVFHVIVGLLVLTAAAGLFEEQAYAFVKHISERNLAFIGAVAELKLVLSGIGDFVPFLKEHSGAVTDTFGKAEDYLLRVEVISLIQLMLLGVSKSWLIKGALLALFLLSIFGKSKSLSTKLLILGLTINPGLQLFSVTMEHLSKTAAIDYGDAYVTKLQDQLTELKAEKAKISQEHAKHLTKINNGKKGLVFLKKLKEDISYDVKKATTSIKGDYTHLRLLIHDGGKELLKKISIFCSMVLFSMLIMPIGYSLIVYTVYKSVVTPTMRVRLQEVEDKLESAEKDNPALAPVDKIKSWFKKGKGE